MRLFFKTENLRKFRTLEIWNFVSKVSGFQFLSFSDFKKNLLSVDFFFLTFADDKWCP